MKLGLILSTLFVFIASMSEIFNFQLFFSFLLSFCLLDHINVAFLLVYYEFSLNLHGEWPGMKNKMFGQRVAWGE